MRIGGGAGRLWRGLGKDALYGVWLIWAPKNVSHKVVKSHFVEAVNEDDELQEVHGGISR